MATIYHYYYVGESGERRDGQRTPMLLTFSRVKNGPIGENKPHSHAYLEIFAFESGHGYFESGKKKLELRAGEFFGGGGGRSPCAVFQ